MVIGDASSSRPTSTTASRTQSGAQTVVASATTSTRAGRVIQPPVDTTASASPLGSSTTSSARIPRAIQRAVSRASQTESSSPATPSGRRIATRPFATPHGVRGSSPTSSRRSTGIETGTSNVPSRATQRSISTNASDVPQLADTR